MKKHSDFLAGLSVRGRAIFTMIKGHCEKQGIWNDAFTFEATALANSFDMYYQMMVKVRKEGTTIKMGTNGYKQLNPSLVVMNEAYAKIGTNGRKFGLNPLDLDRAFKDQSAKPVAPIAKIQDDDEDDDEFKDIRMKVSGK